MFARRRRRFDRRDRERVRMVIVSTPWVINPILPSCAWPTFQRPQFPHEPRVIQELDPALTEEWFDLHVVRGSVLVHIAISDAHVRKCLPYPLGRVPVAHHLLAAVGFDDGRVLAHDPCEVGRLRADPLPSLHYVLHDAAGVLRMDDGQGEGIGSPARRVHGRHVVQAPLMDEAPVEPTVTLNDPDKIARIILQICRTT